MPNARASLLMQWIHSSASSHLVLSRRTPKFPNLWCRAEKRHKSDWHRVIGITGILDETLQEKTCSFIWLSCSGTHPQQALHFQGYQMLLTPARIFFPAGIFRGSTTTKHERFDRIPGTNFQSPGHFQDMPLISKYLEKCPFTSKVVSPTFIIILYVYFGSFKFRYFRKKK